MYIYMHIYTSTYIIYTYFFLHSGYKMVKFTCVPKPRRNDRKDSFPSHRTTSSTDFILRQCPLCQGTRQRFYISVSRKITSLILESDLNLYLLSNTAVSEVLEFKPSWEKLAWPFCSAWWGDRPRLQGFAHRQGSRDSGWRVRARCWKAWAWPHLHGSEPT